MARIRSPKQYAQLMRVVFQCSKCGITKTNAEDLIEHIDLMHAFDRKQRSLTTFNKCEGMKKHAV